MREKLNTIQVRFTATHRMTLFDKDDDDDDDALWAEWIILNLYIYM